MPYYPVKTPSWLPHLFPDALWHYTRKSKAIYLTFDDGPTAELTPWILKTLDDWGAKASFFCVGENIKKHPQRYQAILEKGHTIGNHTFNHLNGWKSKNKVYYENIDRNAHQTGSRLFRPPYGKMKPSQFNTLSNKYRLVFWDILSGDFDPKLSPQQCLDNIILNAQKGSIIVLHDNLKSRERLLYVLPKILQHYSSLGWQMKKIDPY